MNGMEKPPILRGSEQEQINALRDYLFRMASSLGDVLTADTTTQTAVQMTTRGDGTQVLRAGGGTARDTEAVRKNAQELKALIIKSAKELQNQIDGIESSAFYIQYADDFAGDHPEEMYTIPRESTCYMGVCTSTSQEAPTDPGAYAWTRVKGESGRGISNAAVFLYQRAAEMPALPEVPLRYHFETGRLELGALRVTGRRLRELGGIVTGRKVTVTESAAVAGTCLSLAADWQQTIPETDGNPCWVTQTVASTAEETGEILPDAWSTPKKLVEDGAQGVPGPTGADGRTAYLHIKYSDDGESFTDDDGETLGAFIGMYTDFQQEDSLVFTDYAWRRFADDTELKAIIEAGDSYVIDYCDRKVEEYDSRYVAASAFGTFEENINSRIETTARGVIESYDYASSIDSLQDSIDLLQRYYTKIDGEIRRGIVQDPDTGEYVTGIAISQRLQFSGECGPTDGNNPGDGYTYYYLSQGQTFGLYTSTGWQFWINGTRRGWFDSVDGMLHVGNLAAEAGIQLGADWIMTAVGGFGIRHI